MTRTLDEVKVFEGFGDTVLAESKTGAIRYFLDQNGDSDDLMDAIFDDEITEIPRHRWDTFTVAFVDGDEMEDERTSSLKDVIEDYLKSMGDIPELMCSENY